MVKVVPEAASKPPPAPTAVGSTIRAVELETGIPAMTLRDWEKRFGFPAPERRPGSDRRLYSNGDVQRLRLIRGAMQRGYRIGDLINKPNGELETIAGAGGMSRPDPPGGLASAPEQLEGLVSLLARDDLDTFQARIQHAASSYGARRFLTDFAHPLMTAVGEAWEHGRLSVRHEHLASDYLATAMRQMLAQLQPSGSSPVVLLGTLPNEVYTLPMLFAGLFFAALGAKLRMLHGRTPAEEIAAAARAMRVEVVGISVSRSTSKRETVRDLRRLRELLPEQVRLWVGGAGAAGLALSPHVAETVVDWAHMERALETVTQSRLRRRRAAR